MRHHTFNTFWHGPPLSPLHWVCLRSFLDSGHRLRLWSYQPVAVPVGVEIEDARRILPEAELFEFHGSASAFSNLFRYELLLEQGGWWIDADVYCLKEDLPDGPHAWAREDDDFINGAILRFPAGDPALAAIRSAARRVGRDVTLQGQLGPRLLTEHLGAQDAAFGSTRTFYPLHWLEAHRLWMRDDEPFVRATCRDACFVHLWGMMFRYFGIDPRVAPPPGSFLHQIQEGSDFPHALHPLDAATELRSLEAIRAFLDTPQYRERSQRVLGYDVLATVRAHEPR